jgi:hypothetical protein
MRGQKGLRPKIYGQEWKMAKGAMAGLYRNFAGRSKARMSF